MIFYLSVQTWLHIRHKFLRIRKDCQSQTSPTLLILTPSVYSVVNREECRKPSSQSEVTWSVFPIDCVRSSHNQAHNWFVYSSICYVLISLDSDLFPLGNLKQIFTYIWLQFVRSNGVVHMVLSQLWFLQKNPGCMIFNVSVHTV